LQNFRKLLSYLVVQTYLKSIKEIEKKRGIRKINEYYPNMAAKNIVKNIPKIYRGKSV
jgi:predicted transcriptional regulator